MIRKINGTFHYFAPKWIILCLDIGVAFLSFILAVFIRFNFEITTIEFDNFFYSMFYAVGLQSLLFYLLKTHHGIVRHTNIQDGIKIFKSVLYAMFFLIISNLLFGNILNGYLRIPLSIILIDSLLLLFGLILMRISIRSTYEFILTKSANLQKQKTIIYGAGILGLATKNTLNQDKKVFHEILCFIDDNQQKAGKTLEGIPVISRQRAIAKYLNTPEAIEETEIIFAINTIDNKEKNEIVDEFLEMGAHMKIVPPMEEWIQGTLQLNQIKEIKIEDLLNREPIKLDNSAIRENIDGNIIFVSGAAGSIGSEIARQITRFNPKTLVLIDHSESALYDLETEIKRLDSANKELDIIFEVGSVTNEFTVSELFKKYKPKVVFHAAAYKHVPLMENNPYQAILTNIGGTKIMADYASKHQVEKFVLISTDKAVNPTNVMGATKRMAEIYVQSLNNSAHNQTQFIVTRFGNVLGSNGSVIPLFKKQIEKGGPITVTHPDIIRYFMTIPEACQLVLEAFAMGSGGEIFVFDMGEPVKIAKLAEKMIRLSGFVPYKDINIEYIGLREGEKLYEELLGHGENEVPTHHHKIKIATLPPYDYKGVNFKICELKNEMNKMDKYELVYFLKQIIPEYISNNSDFNKLDAQKMVSEKSS